MRLCSFPYDSSVSASFSNSRTTPPFIIWAGKSRPYMPHYSPIRTPLTIHKSTLRLLHTSYCSPPPTLSVDYGLWPVDIPPIHCPITDYPFRFPLSSLKGCMLHTPSMSLPHRIDAFLVPHFLKQLLPCWLSRFQSI